MAIFQAHGAAILEWLRRGGADPYIATSHHRLFALEGTSTGLSGFTLSTAFPTPLPIDNDGTVWNVPIDRDVPNLVLVDFGFAAANETLNGGVELDGSGNPRNWYRFSTPVNILSGDPLKIPIGSFLHGMRDQEFNWQAQQILEHLRGLGTYTPPSASRYYLIKTVGDPTDPATFTYSTLFSSYIAKNNDTSVWGAASGLTVTNLVDFDFGVAGAGSPETIVGAVEKDASGNALTWLLLDFPRNVNAGDPMVISTGKLTDKFVQEFA